MHEQLLERQSQRLRKVDRALENFKKIGKNNLTAAKIRSRLTALTDIGADIESGHFALLAAIPPAERAAYDYFQDQHYELNEEKRQTVADYMKECLEELEPYVSPNQSLSFGPQSPVSPSSACALSHLPPIKLPPFDGKYEEWESFRDRFTSIIINNKDVSNFSRMHYLVSCLRDRALDCVKDIAVTAENFDIAWTTLNARFENKRRLINIHMTTLLNLPTVVKESAQELQSLRDKINTAIAALNKLNRTPEELWSDILVSLGSQKLDAVTRKAWNLKLSENRNPSSYEDFKKFLDNRIRALEEWKLPSSSSDKPKNSNTHRINANACAQSLPSCSLCKAKHAIYACPKFIEKSPNQRRDMANKERRCFNCLSLKHGAKTCSSKYSCRLCQRKHHTLLHVDSDSSSNKTDITTPIKTPQAEESRGNDINSLFASSHTNRLHVLLATARITVSASSGRSVHVRALLDQGSEMTFITEELAQCLRLKRIRMPTSVSAVGCVNAGTYRYAAHITISPKNKQNPAFSTTALILKSLTAYAPKRMPLESTLAHLEDLPWADHDPMSADPISIIVGAELYSALIKNGIRKGAVGQPIAQNSVLGWVISGPITSHSQASHAASVESSRDQPSLKVNAHHCFNSLSLEQEIKRFWEIEEIPRRANLTPDDEKCEKHFCLTHSRDPDGRYIVRLPFKEGPPLEIGCSRAIAEKYLKGLLRRFATHPEQRNEYSEFLHEYEALGHMREVPASSYDNAQCVFIPHHPVIREDSKTTHLRVVFNASCPTSNGSSLNDHLLSGPKLQPDLPIIILQWRRFRYVYTADATKMYRQIRVDPRDLTYQRILWQTSLSDPMKEFILLTVTYGTAAAPFLALRVLNQLAIDEGKPFPLAVKILLEQKYVDEVFFGDDNRGPLRRARQELISLLRKGGFELRKWASNDTELLSDIDPSNHGLACQKVLQDDENLKILGISWNPARDVFQFHVATAAQAPKTKRTILSMIAKLFDPLGWVTPVTITAKVFMQRLWRLKLNWDEELPSDALHDWQIVYHAFMALTEVSLPRWTGHDANSVRCELHGFADASTVAYAAVIYLRIISTTNEVTISLIAAKSKVAPIKTLSVPRLELSAALLLSELMKFVQDSIKVEILERYCWSDSEIVLSWLKKHPSHWKTFVANRVSRIQTLLPNVTWRHVATRDNPADCASRGLLGRDLVNHPLWWHGPSWLETPPETWPDNPSSTHDDSLLEEKNVTVHLANPNPHWDLASQYSDWAKLIRITAYTMKFISCCRKKDTSTESASQGLALTAPECQLARSFWIKTIQRELFPNELTALSNNRQVSAKSPLLSLNPFVDHEGLLRVGGRLKNAPISFNSKHPILLASHPLVMLIIRQAHVRSLHAGTQLTLATLRQDFWILRARSMIRSVIHKCVVCTREKAAVPHQLMGDLPALRVSAPIRSFLHCGLDYAGPVQVRTSKGRGIKSHKAYIALFVCLATRAIHLELVGDYSTSAFLDAFSRFSARRGLPQTMYSDNGTTFVGADKELSKAFYEALKDPTFLNATASDNVTWHFIPPSAPHFGGLWEAGVRSMKHHLRRVLKDHTLTFEELTTLLCRIEACLNSRPLAPLKDTLDDYEVLTPGHFLIGSSITVNPEPSLLNLNENRLSRWQRVRHLTERFWKLWQTDYVNTLQQRIKWQKLKPLVTVGQLVLLQNATLPPCKWLLGRITQCHPGSDGLVRVVTVKTATAEYTRPIVKLCLLPINSETHSDEPSASNSNSLHSVIS